MPQILLTEFVDIVSASGTPKATKVRQAKHRLPYNPVADFYKRIREDIIIAHQNGQGKTYIDNTLTGLTDQKKLTAYPPIVAGYKKWWGRKSFSWFDPPNVNYSYQGIDVLVNPELGLEYDGIPYLIKLYFKGEPLAKNRVEIITQLMTIAALGLCPSPSTVMSVLDVRRARLISPTMPLIGLTDILNAELAYIANLWPSI